MSVKVKICGTRSYEAAKTAIDAGADFLGFILIPSSKRYIEAEAARQIIGRIAGKIGVVGVFENPIPHRVNELVRYLGLQYVQLHGSETNEYCHGITASVIKAFRLLQGTSVANAQNLLRSYDVGYHMVDRAKQGIGTMVDFSLAKALVGEFKLFYSGGLLLENVAEIVKRVQPFAVDVASGVETDGKHDLVKIREFIRRAKGVVYE